jgi:[protein-PII] uridylyltransferase
MAQGGGLRETVLDARRRLSELREGVAAAHDRGLAGLRVAERLSAGIDDVVRLLFDSALDGIDASHGLRDHVALVAHGGNGRRQVAPYSDLDLMVLHDGRARAASSDLARRFMQDVFDANLKLGQSLRTLSDVVELVRDDAKTCSSLIETRLVAGSQSLYDEFRDRYDKTIKRRSRAIIAALIEERAAERAQFGETNYLLEPNVKRSRGGLRDLHLLRWLAYIRHGTADWDRLRAAGGLGKLDHHRLRTAQEFLLRLRNEMHFHAHSAMDTLSRTEQQRISKAFGFRDHGGLFAVERFMKEYFWNTTQVWNVVERFIASSTPSRLPRILQPVVTQVVEDDFRVGPKEVSATPQGAAKLQKNLSDVMRFVELANRHGKRIAAPIWGEMNLAVPRMDKHVPREAYVRFLSLLREPKRLGPLLRRLLELGVLERLIPAFRHARCLLQANNLHKFTVDEHCIYAVQCATELRLSTGPVADAYEQIPDKLVLHLALLVHDLGKGFEEDHSEVGRRIARETAEQLGLSAEDAEAVEWLVYRHLALSRAALWRDPNDPQNVAQFAALVPSFELLRMLYVLTCCDIQAVGPGVMTDWKGDMLTLFYRKVAARIRGDGDGHDGAQEVRLRVLRAAEESGASSERLAALLDALPDSQIVSSPAAEVAAALARWSKLEGGSADVSARYRDQTKTIEFTVAVDRGVGSGAFAKLAGTLSGQGLQILSADLAGQEDGLLVIGFETTDTHGNGRPERERIDKICNELGASMHRQGPPKLRRLWSDASTGRQAALSTLSHRVEFENAASRHTIVEVYTFDRRGLLYSIAQRIHDLGLTIHRARIATYLDQVVDVFYVTDRQGNKVTDPERLADIRSSLLEVVSSDGKDA